MRFILVIVLASQFLFRTIPIEAQLFAHNPDSVYGFNPLLYNGRLYSFVLPRSTVGSPFLYGSEFTKGQVTIRGKTYKDLDLNYDIYNQQLFLKFINAHGATQVIEISKSWLEEFSLGQMHFEPVQSGNGQIDFYQVIKSDSLKIMYYWKKELHLEKAVGETGYKFSKPLRKQYILIDQVSKRYRNNKEFIRAFPEKYQNRISDYLRMNRIKVRRISDSSMLELVEYGNTLLVE